MALNVIGRIRRVDTRQVEAIGENRFSVTSVRRFYVWPVLLPVLRCARSLRECTAEAHADVAGPVR